MDIMDNKTNFLDEETVEAKVDIPTEKIRKPYVEWCVREKVYKLKLTTGVIRRLEQGWNTSLLSAVLDEGIPSVDVLSTLLQGALQKFHHGIKSMAVDEMLDEYFEAGGTQFDLLREVVYPLMHDAGFFTQAQMDLLTKELSEADSNL